MQDTHWVRGTQLFAEMQSVYSMPPSTGLSYLRNYFIGYHSKKDRGDSLHQVVHYSSIYGIYIYIYIYYYETVSFVYIYISIKLSLVFFTKD